MLAGEALYGDRIDRHFVQTRVEALRPARRAGGVFREQRVEEAALRRAVLDDRDAAAVDAPEIREPGVAFETTVVKNPARRVLLEPDAALARDVAAEMA